MAVVVDQIFDSDHVASGIIRVGRKSFSIRFGSRLQLAQHAADALLAISIPAAMRRNEPLIINGEVSPLLLRNSTKIQKLYNSWDADLHMVEIQAATRDSAIPTAGPEALCFTGGVDSMHAALSLPDASLMYVHGLDVPLRNSSLRKEVSQKLTGAAAELGRPFLEMETNLRDFSDRFLSWNLAYGGGLAACAYFLSDQISSIALAAGAAYVLQHADGAHPLLNHLFSTEQIEVHIVGNDIERIDKLKDLSNRSIAKNYLRVCWENRGNCYNCGACEKCLRTMSSLQAFGRLSQFKTFDIPLDYTKLSRAVVPHSSMILFIEHILNAAQENHASTTLIHALESYLAHSRSPRYRMMSKLIPNRVLDWQYRANRYLHSILGRSHKFGES